MNSDQVIVSISNLGKAYHLYEKPSDRLKQMLLGKLSSSSDQLYREFWALRHVSFEVTRGETVGIIGRNGSGKSTLLQLITGILHPTEGEVRVGGRISALLELGSGFNPDFTGLENVYLSGGILGISRSEMEKRLPDILEFADIGDFVNQPVKTYSSGMHARLAFAVAIHVDPEILIVDEILAVGDAAFQAKCTRAFNRIRDDGATVLLVTQDPYMVRTFCTKAIYLRRGEMIGFGDPHLVTEKYLDEIESAELSDSAREKALESNRDIVASENRVTGPVYRITNVEMVNEDNKVVNVVVSGQAIRLRFHYRRLIEGFEKVVFVFSLYRKDGTYVCGNTTLMDGKPPFATDTEGHVEITFTSFPLLSGNYQWRVAIDDEKGLGIYCESFTDYFTVTDHLEAVGLINLPREWKHYSRRD